MISSSSRREADYNPVKGRGLHECVLIHFDLHFFPRSFLYSRGFIDVLIERQI